MNATPAQPLVSVLCFYTYSEPGRMARHGLRYRGSKMIRVLRSTDIVEAFYAALEEDCASWGVWRVGAKPCGVELTGYLPETFRRAF